MTSFIKVTIINHIQVWNARHGLSSLISLLLKRVSYPLFLGVVRSYYLKNRPHTVLRSDKQTRQLNFKGEVYPFFLFHLETQSQSFEVCIILCFRMPLTAKRMLIPVRNRADYVCRDYGSIKPTYPSPKLQLTLTSHLGQNVGLGEG